MFALVFLVTLSLLVVNQVSCYGFRTSRTLLKMSEAAPAAPEWAGAKKFSMKDRYTNTVISSDQISKILPHRYPFLLVVRVVEFEPGQRAVGIKCVTANEYVIT